MLVQLQRYFNSRPTAADLVTLRDITFGPFQAVVVMVTLVNTLAYQRIQRPYIGFGLWLSTPIRQTIHCCIA